MIHLGINIETIELLLAIELAIIVLVLLTAYIFLYMRKRAKLRAAALKEEIKEFLEKAISENAEVEHPPGYLRFTSDHNVKVKTAYYTEQRFINLFIPLFIEFDKTHSGVEGWKTVEQSILHNFLLPLARKWATSKKWILRFYAAELFSLMSEPGDEDTIIGLLKDEVNLVNIHTIKAAAKIPSEKVYRYIVEDIVGVNWLMASMYVDQLDDICASSVAIIQKLMNESNDPEFRAVCYRILLLHPPSGEWLHEDDIYAKDQHLHLTSLKYYVHVKGREAIPVLAEFLTHPDWQVRVVAALRLGMLKAEDKVDDIAKLLDDEDSWVEIGAVMALKELGKPGLDKLSELHKSISEFDINLNKYLHYILW